VASASDLRGDPGFLGRGWTFPVVPGPSGRLGYSAGEDSIQEAIRIILGTSPGERVMRPEFGCGIWDLVFEANTAQLHGRVQVHVREALVRWEPRIDVLDVRVEAPPEQKNLLLVRIDYRVRANNAFFNLVYPFFLQEGPER
jgi:phage baseplate assembly protein W